MHTTPGVWGFTVVAVAFVSASAAAQTTPRLEPIATFGCDDCDGPLLFSDVRELVWIDPDRLLVVDGDAPFLRVFIAAGEPITAFAREGAGPGELRTPMAAAVGGEDTIEVIDIRTLRLTRFSLAGDLIGTRPIPERIFPVAAARPPGADAWTLLTTDFATPTPAVYRLPDEGALVRLVESQPDFPRNRQGSPTGFAAFAVAPDGSFALGEGAFAYRIRRFTADGSPLDEIVRNVPRPRRTPAEMQAALERRDRMAGRLQAMRRAEGGDAASLPEVPAEHDYFAMGSLAFDRHGRLWVRTTRGGDDRTVFDLFAPSGDHLGEVPVTGGIGAFTFGDGVLAAAVTGSDGVPRIATWRVVER